MVGKPKHEALSDWIRDRILAGTFPIGSRLPSEHELAQRFRLSLLKCSSTNCSASSSSLNMGVNSCNNLALRLFFRL